MEIIFILKKAIEDKMMKTIVILALTTLCLVGIDLSYGANSEFPLTPIVYREKDGYSMVVMIESGRTETPLCFRYGDRRTFQEIVKLIPKDIVKEVSKEEMTELLNKCSEFSFNELENEAFRIQKRQIATDIPLNIEEFLDMIKRILRFYSISESSIKTFLKSLFDLINNNDVISPEDPLLIPGTKWCGPGNRGENYNDLGIFSDADACCRDHDHCNNSIKVGETKCNLTNNGLLARMSCDCDDVLYSCLKNSCNVISELVGILFFDIMRNKCFEVEYPQVRCKEPCSTLLILQNSNEYELDTTKEKICQFFDPRCYDVSPECVLSTPNGTSPTLLRILLQLLGILL